jgi:hypothetical protein
MSAKPHLSIFILCNILNPWEILTIGWYQFIENHLLGRSATRQNEYYKYQKNWR